MAGPMTITGSIGSISGFFNMKGFYDKIGFNKDGVAFGPMAELGTDMRDPTDKEWERYSDAHYISFPRHGQRHLGGLVSRHRGAVLISDSYRH